jgi:outer membrane protein assembly factor BamE (lipoprotein component of BamABCDE complex)
MGLAVGMTKGQVFDLSGTANYLEGYDWGSVWFYKWRKGGNEGTLANKDIEQRYMPVVFDNTDRVMGYGRKFYDQTLSDLGSGQF